MRYSSGSSPAQVAVGPQLVNAFEGHVRIDGVGPVAAEHAEVHHLAGLAAFDDDAGFAPEAPFKQAVVQGRRGQQAGDGDVLGEMSRSLQVSRAGYILLSVNSEQLIVDSCNPCKN